MQSIRRCLSGCCWPTPDGTRPLAIAKASTFWPPFCWKSWTVRKWRASKYLHYVFYTKTNVNCNVRTGDDLLDRRRPTLRLFRQQLARIVHRHGRLPRPFAPAATRPVASLGNAPAIRVIEHRLLLFFFLLHRAAVDQCVHNAVVPHSLRHLPAESGRPPRLGSHFPRRQRRPPPNGPGHLADTRRVIGYFKLFFIPRIQLISYPVIPGGYWRWGPATISIPSWLFWLARCSSSDWWNPITWSRCGISKRNWFFLQM